MPPTNQAPVNHQLTWIYPDSLNGSLIVAPRLEMTRELRRLGWQVTFLCAGPAGNQTIHGVEVTCLPRIDKYVLRQVVFHWRILLYLVKHRSAIDIVYFNQPSLPVMLLLRLFRKIRRQQRPVFVMDSRTVPMEGGNATIKDRLRGTYSNLMNYVANWQVDGQTTITYRMAEQLKIPTRQLWGIWSSGVDIDAFLPLTKTRHWPEGNEPVKLVYLGSFATERDVMILSQAVVKANLQGTNFELFLIGDGRERQNLIDFASHSDGKILVIPPVPHDQIPKILAGMHVGTLPFADEPQFRVSSPIKLFEYLGSGMPVLATRIVCHTDVIGEQACAFWAENSSVVGYQAAMQEIWNKRNKLASMGMVASRLAREHTWAASAKQLSTALEGGMAARLR
jgi:glycosyltransferase involved in cell wall biosynthesis